MSNNGKNQEGVCPSEYSTRWAFHRQQRPTRELRGTHGNFWLRRFSLNLSGRRYAGYEHFSVTNVAPSARTLAQQADKEYCRGMNRQGPIALLALTGLYLEHPIWGYKTLSLCARLVQKGATAGLV